MSRTISIPSRSSEPYRPSKPVPSRKAANGAGSGQIGGATGPDVVAPDPLAPGPDAGGSPGHSTVGLNESSSSRTGLNASA